MDDVNIQIDELVLDGPFPSAEQLQTALSRAAPSIPEQYRPKVAVAVTDSLRSGLGVQPR